MSDVSRQHGAKDRSERPTAADDPAPYAWLDDDNRMAGTISPGATMVFGAFFLVTATASAVAAVATQHLPGLWFALGFALLGAQLLRMGLARRAWRSRHPGIDPLSSVPSPTGGSAFGPDTRTAAVGRAVLLVFCLLVGLVFVIATIQSFLAGSSATVGTKLVLVFLSALVLAVGWYDLRRILQLRSEGRHDGEA